MALAAFYSLPSTSPNPAIRDSDGDGIADAGDAFPSDRTQWSDRDHDGFGDNPSGFNPDSFPDDPEEWRDADRDGIGDNADIYDSGDGAVRIWVTSLVVARDCDTFSACDPMFTFRLDANGDGLDECVRTSQEYSDTNVLSNPSDAFVVCNIGDGDQLIDFSIIVVDNDVFNAPEPIDYAEPGGNYYTYTWLAPFSGSQTETGDGSDGYPATLAWSIQVVAG